MTYDSTHVKYLEQVESTETGFFGGCPGRGVGRWEWRVTALWYRGSLGIIQNVLELAVVVAHL